MLLLASAALLISQSPAQAPIEVSLCDLVKDPSKYNQQEIKVRGQVSIGFEDFTLATRQCGNEHHRWIWLAYGGDEPTPTVSTVNDRERPEGSVLKVKGMPVHLQRSPDLELFKSRLIAQRLAPDLCHLFECHFYNVSATFTAVFFAAEDYPRSGYGHLGCCHLLVIERVADVHAERTGVPAGGRFTCSADTWELDATQAQEFIPQRSCTDLADCEARAREQLDALAAHWGDSIAAGPVDRYLMGSPTWQSPDLTRTYSFQFHYDEARHHHQKFTGATVSRRVCKAVTPPYPPEVPINCRSIVSDFAVNKADKKPMQKPAATGGTEPRYGGEPQAIAREALEEAARRWGVVLAPALVLRECDKPMAVNGTQFSWCHWEDPDAMQEFSIEIERSGFLGGIRGWDKFPWILRRADGMVCAAELR